VQFDQFDNLLYWLYTIFVGTAVTNSQGSIILAELN